MVPVMEQDSEIVMVVVVTTESSAWATGRLKKSIERKVKPSKKNAGRIITLRFSNITIIIIL